MFNLTLIYFDTYLPSTDHFYPFLIWTKIDSKLTLKSPFPMTPECTMLVDPYSWTLTTSQLSYSWPTDTYWYYHLLDSQHLCLLFCTLYLTYLKNNYNDNDDYKGDYQLETRPAGIVLVTVCNSWKPSSSAGIPNWTNFAS